MMKVIARLEAVVGSRVGHFLLDHDTPLPIAKAMCDQFLQYLQSLEDKAKADNQAEQPKEPQSVEPIEKPEAA